MKAWKREKYNDRMGYYQYVRDGYVIRQTHDKNIWTGKEMSYENQVWEIFKDGTRLACEFRLKDAKHRVDEIMKGGMK